MEAKLIDLNEWERFGGGAAGDSYYHKTDDTVMLKLYFETLPREMAENEFINSQKVFELGIPCSRAYDFVTDGTRYGITFQRMKDKKSFASTVAEDPSKLEQVARDFAQLGKMVHSTKCDTAAFPRQKDIYLKDLENPRVSEPLKQGILKLMDELSDSQTCLHGDFHVGNAIYSEGKPYFIDLGDFAYGDPEIDLCEMFMIAYAASEQNCREQMHMELPLFQKLTDRIIWHYYGLESEMELGLKKQHLAHLMTLQIAHMSLHHTTPDVWSHIQERLIQRM